jgi:hypothetical protein
MITQQVGLGRSVLFLCYADWESTYFLLALTLQWGQKKLAAG